MFGRRGRSAAVARDDGLVSQSAALERHDGFDSCSHGGCPALVDPSCDKRVEFAQELLGESDCDLLGSHGISIPLWDGLRYIPRSAAALDEERARR